MIYLMDKKTWKVMATFENMSYAKNWLDSKQLDITSIQFLTEQEDMIKYVSRIVYMEHEGTKTCIYNNKAFWTGDMADILSNFDNYKFYDILGLEVNRDRFVTELNNNINRLNAIDGRPGEILYNADVGSEFISLFREECILTDFSKDANTSPMIIFNKLATVIAMVDVGAFREAKQYIQGYKAKLLDDFLTNDRLDKYVEMLDAADTIEYATEEDYFYTAPPSTSST